jgi:hypothetical protein
MSWWAVLPSKALENLMSRTWTLLHCAALVASTALMACAYEVEAPEEEDVSTKKEAILNGAPANEAKLGAVGALVISVPEFEIYDVFCSATLIADKAVVTARHCMPMVQDALDFGSGAYVAFGPDAFNPTQMVPIEAYVTAPPSPTGEGLLMDGGRDVAVAYLSAKPKNIKPAKIGSWHNNMLGQKFEIAGYGVYDTAGSFGQKYAGTVKARAVKGFWYPLLFNGNKANYLEWYNTDAFTNPTPEEAELWWTSFKLETNYELLAGGLPNESLGCFGDSGGPLLQGSNANNLTTYGVNFATESQFSTICGLGGAYAVFNKTMEKFVEDAVKQPCKGRKDRAHSHGHGHGHDGHGHGHFNRH